MSSKQAKLLEPFNLRDLELKNRVVMVPMTRARAGEERIPNALMAKYYLQRASAGLIITEATTISEQANGWVQSPGIYTDAMAAGWQQVVDAVHGKGGTIFLQLWHCGRASHSSFHNGYTRETAEKAVNQDPAVLIAFGRSFISNPDLVTRFANNWPLNPEADMSTWYSPTGANGYIDFPVAQEGDFKN